MELIDRIKKDIDDRLEELRPQVEEIPRLEALLAAIDADGGREGAGAASGAGTGTPRRGRPPGSGARSGSAGRRSAGSPRRRARRGQRREELLQLVGGNPSITIAEAARQMGVSSPQISTLVRRLEEEGSLRREDGRFVVVAPAGFAAREEGEPEQAGTGEASEPAEVEASAPGGDEVLSEDPPPQDIQGPGVESIAGEEGIAEAESVPEPARDEAGRPPAT